MQEAAPKRAEWRQYPTDIVTADTLDLYRTFNSLESYLQYPGTLDRQDLFPFDHKTCHALVAKYYEFDASVLREILGKPLTRSQRKDLDEVADKSGRSLKSCSRQVASLLPLLPVMRTAHGLLLP